MRLPPLPSVREILQMYNLRAAKELSQNFLLDRRITDRIALGIPSNARLVVEVGCGPGCLTRSILDQCQEMNKLVGVEKDERFLPALQMLGQAVNFRDWESGSYTSNDSGNSNHNSNDDGGGGDAIFQPLADHDAHEISTAELHESSDDHLDDHILFQLVHGDILRINERKLLQRFEDSYRRDNGEEAQPGDIVFTGNLPFGIATPLLIKWLRLLSEPWSSSVSLHDNDTEWDIDKQIDRDLTRVSMLLMFQREVAERIASKPGKKDYGRLSVLTQNWFNARILFHVKGGSFVPPPKVDASVLLMEPRATGPLVPGVSFDELEQFVQMVFKARRKRIASTIKQDVFVHLASSGQFNFDDLDHSRWEHSVNDDDSDNDYSQILERRNALIATQADKLVADLFREAFPETKNSDTLLDSLMYRRAQEFTVEEMCKLAKVFHHSHLVRGLRGRSVEADWSNKEE